MSDQKKDVSSKSRFERKIEQTQAEVQWSNMTPEEKAKVENPYTVYDDGRTYDDDLDNETFGEAIKNTVAYEVNETIDGFKQIYEIEKAASKRRDEEFEKRNAQIRAEIEYGNMTEEERQNVENPFLSKKKQEEKEAQEKLEKEEAEKRKKEEEEAEKQRLEDMKETYVVNQAEIICDQAFDKSFVIVPKDHGVFIHGKPQLNVGDSIPNVNIMSFGICTCASNPSVIKSQATIMKKVYQKKKGVWDRVMGTIAKPVNNPIMVATNCVGPCMPMIVGDWTDGNEKVLIEGKPALIGKCTIKCQYGGTITLLTTGQEV